MRKDMKRIDDDMSEIYNEIVNQLTIEAFWEDNFNAGNHHGNEHIDACGAHEADA